MPAKGYRRKPTIAKECLMCGDQFNKRLKDTYACYEAKTCCSPECSRKYRKKHYVHVSYKCAYCDNPGKFMNPEKLCMRHYAQVKYKGKVLETTKFDRRKAVINNDVAQIPLGVGAKQGHAIVDKEDVWLEKYNWVQATRGDVVTTIDGECVRLHRVVMGAAKGEYVDHINHDTLDNRRSNLRICTNAQNQWNKPAPPSNKSGYKGVHKSSRGNKYISQIMVNGRRETLGSFNTPEEANEAYQQASRKYHGEFAYGHLSSYISN